ncbi:MAG: hypothetical protein RLZ14_754 [Actinomycetota bacterium]
MSAPGGVQDQVTGLARALTRLGHHAEVIAPGHCDHRDVESVGVGRSHAYAANGSMAPLAPQPSAAVRTIAAIHRGDFDVLHLHEPLAPSITLAALMTRGTPIVGTFHAAGDRTPYSWFAPPLRMLAQRLDARVAVSDSARDLAAQFLGGTYEVLFNGIDLTPYEGPPPPRTAAPSVLFLGRHDPRKGLDVLLRASRQLPPEVLLYVAGDGPDTAELQRSHRGSRVRWLGRISDADKVRRLRSAWALCAPSLHGESFGIVLLEAMAAGTPIAASDLPGYRSLTDHGAAALLSAPGDVDGLAESLSTALFQPAVTAPLVARGSAIAARMSIDELARRYVAIYERAIAQRVADAAR